jgi:hypothetical protein
LSNKKNRCGTLKSHEKAKNYSYSASFIQWALFLLISGAISIRGVANVMKINSIFVDLPTPSHTVVSEWYKKIGFYIYNLEKDKNIKRAWIIDFSVEFGEAKLMMIIGINIEKIETLKKNKRFKIGYQDVEILHKATLKSTTYDKVLQELEKTAEKCGLPQFIVSDQGNDLLKGIKIFIENNPGIQHLNDISHKLSNILKAELEKDPKWHDFSQTATNIKQKLKLSNIAEICPPKFRQKVRFLGVGKPIKWAMLMLNLNISCFDPKQKMNFQKYIKEPLERLRKEIVQWNEYVRFINAVEIELKHKGLTRGDKKNKIKSSSQILSELLLNQIKPKKLKFYNQVIKFIEEQETKLLPGQTMICSSDIIESLFGKWKSMSHEDSMVGITDLILMLPLFTVNLTEELVLKALEGTSMKEINEWKEKNFGKTLYAKRRSILAKTTEQVTPTNSKKKDRKLGELSREISEKVA